MQYEDVGDHYYNTGDAVNALKHYARIREYVSNPSQIAAMCLKIVKVCDVH
jgi:COP9 signalosome complex subunit 1